MKTKEKHSLALVSIATTTLNYNNNPYYYYCTTDDSILSMEEVASDEISISVLVGAVHCY